MAVSNKHAPVTGSTTTDYPVPAAHRDKGLQFLFLDLYRIKVSVHVVRFIGCDGIFAHNLSEEGDFLCWKGSIVHIFKSTLFHNSCFYNR